MYLHWKVPSFLSRISIGTGFRSTSRQLTLSVALPAFLASTVNSVHLFWTKSFAFRVRNLNIYLWCFCFLRFLIIGGEKVNECILFEQFLWHMVFQFQQQHLHKIQLYADFAVDDAVATVVVPDDYYKLKSLSCYNRRTMFLGLFSLQQPITCYHTLKNMSFVNSNRFFFSKMCKNRLHKDLFFMLNSQELKL